MIVTKRKNLTCTDSLVCSDALLTRLENTLRLKLHADTETDVGMEGSLSIGHTPNNHFIRVEIYEVTQGRIKKPVSMPTRQRVENAI